MPLTAEDLTLCIQEAARIRVDIEPRVRDALRIKDRKEILYYAVDTNSVKLYTAPYNAPLGRKGKSFTGIFSKTRSESVYAFERTFAEYIYFHLTENLPLLQIPPHEEETLRLFHAKVVTIKKQFDHVNTDSKLVKTLLNDFQKTNDREKLKEDLKKYTPKFIRLCYGGNSSLCELKRFNSLLKNDRLMSFNYVIERDNYKGKLDVSIFHPLSTKKDLDVFSSYKDRWFNDLYEIKNKNKKDCIFSNISIDTDASVLARLEFINNALSKENKRLVLITRDEKLMKVADAYQANDGLSFGDLYIRHPRAFIADRSFLNGASSIKTDNLQTRQLNLVESLNYFLAKFASNNEKNYIKGYKELLSKQSNELIGLARNALKHNPSVGEGLLNEWEKLVDAVALSYSFEKDHNITDNKAVSNLIESLKRNEDVDEIIKEIISSAWKSFFGVAMSSGVSIIHSENKSTYLSRNVPIIRFLNKKCAKKYVESFLSTKKTVSDDDLENVLKEDESRYSYYLAFSVLYASAGRWSEAHNLAHIALEIAETKNFQGVYGHEAAFLMAVSLRRKSKEISDLNQVNKYLDIAEKHIRLFAKEHTDIQILPDYRFQNERIALSLGYWLYHIFVGTSRDKDYLERVMSLGECEKEFLDLLPKIIDQCDKEREVIWRSLKLQVISNLFMVALVNKFKYKQDSDYINVFKSYLKTFESFIYGKKESRRDFHISFSQRANYFAMACWLYENDKKQNAKQELVNLLNDTNIKKHSVLPYDKQRYKFLLDTAN